MSPVRLGQAGVPGHNRFYELMVRMAPGGLEVAPCGGVLAGGVYPVAMAGPMAVMAQPVWSVAILARVIWLAALGRVPRGYAGFLPHPPALEG